MAGDARLKAVPLMIVFIVVLLAVLIVTFTVYSAFTPHAYTTTLTVDSTKTYANLCNNPDAYKC